MSTIEIVGGSDGLAGGGSSSSATFMQSVTALTQMAGDTIYKSGIHFNAVYHSATEIDLSAFPPVSSALQFLGVMSRTTAGVISIYLPTKATTPFSWDAVNSRLTVTGAAFNTTDEFYVVIESVNRYADDPGNYLLSAEVSPYPLRSDDSGIQLITAAQTMTGSFADVGPEIPTFGYNRLKLWVTVDINDSTDLQIRVLEKHASGGTEEYNPAIETIGSSDIKVEAAYWEFNVDADQLMTLVHRLDGSTPYIQVQARVGVVGGGTAADIDAIYYTRGTF